MVRMLVGTMVDVGLGRRPDTDMTALLLRRDNSGNQSAGSGRGDFTFSRRATPSPVF